MLDEGTVLELLISNQYRAIRFYFFFAVGLVTLGIALIIVAFSSSKQLIPEALKFMVGVGGGFASSLSAFPIKELLSRKEKVGIFETIKAHIAESEQEQSSIDTDEHKRIDNLLWQAIEKTALG